MKEIAVLAKASRQASGIVDIETANKIECCRNKLDARPVLRDHQFLKVQIISRKGYLFIECRAREDGTGFVKPVTRPLVMPDRYLNPVLDLNVQVGPIQQVRRNPVLDIEIGRHCTFPHAGRHSRSSGPVP